MVILCVWKHSRTLGPRRLARPSEVQARTITGVHVSVANYAVIAKSTYAAMTEFVYTASQGEYAVRFHSIVYDIPFETSVLKAA